MAEQFRIAVDLLAGPDGDGRWNNLGCWAGTTDYTEAARALARLHGEAAGLRPGIRLLELACGHGAALDLWSREFGVAAAYALEVRQDCLAAILARPERSVTGVVQGRFDEPLAALVGDARFDTILCVDAAYHARSLAAFLAACRTVLMPGGGVVFSTLVAGSVQGWPGRFRRAMLRKVLGLAGIPAASFCDRQGLLDGIEAAGFVTAGQHDLTDAVFAGFATWVERRQRALGRMERRSSGWLKIRLTALLCRYVTRSRSMDYVLLVVRDRPQS